MIATVNSIQVLCDGPDANVRAPTDDKKELHGSADSRSDTNLVADLICQREFSWENKPPDVKPVYWIGEVPVCTSGNLTAVTGQPKSGKSSFLAAMAAASMSGGEKTDTLHVKADNTVGRAVIHFDTEQDPTRHDATVRSMVRRTNLHRNPPWFHSYSLKGIEPSYLVRCLEEVLLQNHRSHVGIHSVLIDGIADFVTDPNSAGECFPLVTRLESLAVQYDTSFVCVLHLNPVSSFGSNSKSRGHLGSQLERKVETDIRLQRDQDDAISLWTYRARGEPIPKDKALRIRWSPQEGRHVVTGSLCEDRKGAHLKEQYEEAKEIFGAEREISYTEVVERLAAKRCITQKGAQQRFTTLKNNGLIWPSGRGWRATVAGDLVSA